MTWILHRSKRKKIKNKSRVVKKKVGSENKAMKLSCRSALRQNPTIIYLSYYQMRALLANRQAALWWQDDAWG